MGARAQLAGGKDERETEMCVGNGAHTWKRLARLARRGRLEYLSVLDRDLRGRAQLHLTARGCPGNDDRWLGRKATRPGNKVIAC